MSKDIVTIYDISREFNFSTKHIYELIKQGRVKGVIKIGVLKPIIAIDRRKFKILPKKKKK